MYKQTAQFHRQWGRCSTTDIPIADNGGLRFEMNKRSEVREKMNGASWYKALRQIVTLIGASDASSIGWGVPFDAQGKKCFVFAGDLRGEWVKKHINEQVAYAVGQILPFVLRG